MSGFARQPLGGGIPPGIPPGQTVYVVIEEWAVPEPSGDKGISVESVHLSLDLAQADRGSGDHFRKRSVIALEIQP